jgi:hypothetical protein
VAAADLHLRQLDVVLNELPPKEQRISWPVLMALFDRVVRNARAAVLAGAEEQCVTDALNTRLAPVVGQHLSRLLGEATDVTTVLTIAQWGQLAGVWDPGLDADFWNAFQRLVPGAAA